MKIQNINPFMPHGISHPYLMDESFKFKGCLVVIYNFIQTLKVHYRPDQMPHFVASESDLVLHCLPMSHNLDTRLMG